VTRLAVGDVEGSWPLQVKAWRNQFAHDAGGPRPSQAQEVAERRQFVHDDGGPPQGAAKGNQSVQDAGGPRPSQMAA
jgi:hypothetical protein